LIDLDLTALSAKIGYIVPLKIKLQFKKIEISEKAENVTRWECAIMKPFNKTNSSIWSL